MKCNFIKNIHILKTLPLGGVGGGLFSRFVGRGLFTLLVVIVFASTLQSCLKDDTEVFDEDSSTRMSEYLDNAKKTILDGNATWLMEMYPESEQSYGGYAFIMRFTKDSVYCSTELASSDYEIGSLWRTTRDDGPVLSFDTYNAFIHYFSTPSSTAYQSYQGEFEWIISDVQSDIITLRGKKTGNTIYMRRLNVDGADYLNKCLDNQNSITITGLEGRVGGNDVSVIIDSDYRQMEFFSDTTDVTTAYCITSDGVRFYKPITLNGVEMTGMTTDLDNMGVITGMTTSNGDKLTAVYPEGYRSYKDYVGDYTLSYCTYNVSNNSIVADSEPTVTIDVQIVEDGNGGYLLKGLSPKADIAVSYKKSTGVMEINSQVLGTTGTANDNVWLCAWGLAAGGSLTWATDAGMVSVWNGDESNPSYTFVTNDYSGLVTDSFILWETTSTNTSVGAFLDSSWGFTGATTLTSTSGNFYGNRLPYFTKAILTKK